MLSASVATKRYIGIRRRIQTVQGGGIMPDIASIGINIFWFRPIIQDELTGYIRK